MNHLTRIPAALCVAGLTLSLPLTAQDGGNATTSTSTSTGSPLIIHTSDRSLARDVARMFDGADLPASVAEGQQISLSMDDGGMMSAATRSGTDFLRIEARPAMLMSVYDEQIQQVRMMGQFMIAPQLAQQGMSQQDVIQMIGAVLDFPTQIDRLTFSLPAEPKSPKDPMTATVTIEAVADTWLDKLITASRPQQGGIVQAPMADALAQVNLNVDLPAILPMVKPLAVFASTMQAPDAETRATMTTATEKLYDQLDGSFSMSWSENIGMLSVMGVRDTNVITELMASPMWRELSAAAIEGQDMGEVEFEALDEAYRGSPLYRMRVLYDDPQFEDMFEGGVMEGLQSIAGKHMVSAAMGNNQMPALKGMIDDLLDGNLGRTKMPAGVLMNGSIQLAEAMDMFSAMLAGMGGGLPMDAEELPENASMALTKRGKSLVFELRTK